MIYIYILLNNDTKQKMPYLMVDLDTFQDNSPLLHFDTQRNMDTILVRLNTFQDDIL